MSAEHDYHCDRFAKMTGYKGQSHEVLAEREDGTTTRLGWQNGTKLDAWQPLAEAWHLANLRAELVRQVLEQHVEQERV